MKTAIVATVKVADLPALNDQLTKLAIGKPSYYLLQRADAITDWKEGEPEVLKNAEYSHGRLFGKRGEVRWHKSTRGYSLLWLSEGEIPDGFKSLGKWEMTKSQNVFLLGGGETRPWRDTRIPRDLASAYPMEWCELPKVRVIQYRELNSQTVRFTRYTHFT